MFVIVLTFKKWSINYYELLAYRPKITGYKQILQSRDVQPCPLNTSTFFCGKQDNLRRHPFINIVVCVL